MMIWKGALVPSDPIKLYRSLLPLHRIRRYAQHVCLAPQSVAEHSYYVALLATGFADQLEERGVGVDRGVVMELALWHDAAEAICGDIPHPVKRANDQIYQAFEALEARALARLTSYASAITSEIFLEAANALTLEHLLVKLADWIELVLYVHEESRLGNPTLRPAADRIWSNLKGHLLGEFARQGHNTLAWYEGLLVELHTAQQPGRNDWMDAYEGLTL
jgi:5'-deoxynucleotidase YfbR-like HD superfamily hydrolase